MKYKIGDKVRIKAWEKLAEEYHCPAVYQTIPCPFGYNKTMEADVQSIKTDRILTIEEIINGDSYHMEGLGWTWGDEMIEELIEYHYTIFDDIKLRFELIDFEE